MNTAKMLQIIWALKPIILTIFVLSVIVGALIWALSQKPKMSESNYSADINKTQQPATVNYANDAKWACREFAVDNLKAPSTAKFPNYNKFTAEKINNRETKEKEYIVYRVYGEVDSQNSFGAMLHSRFQCEVIKNTSSDDKWHLVKINFYN